MMLYTNNLFLTTIFSLKAFSANYWYHFYDLYDYNIPVKYNQIKQIVRFTDTGHIASFLYYFYPKFFPIAFNVHFAITFSYWITVKCFDMKDTDIDNDDRIIMSSEAGVLPVNEKNIIKKWRLQPGKMLLVDLQKGEIISDDEIKRDLAGAKPYKEWLARSQIVIEDMAVSIKKSKHVCQFRNPSAPPEPGEG